MENDKEKLEKFFNAVNTSTDEKVREILDEAKDEKKRILSAAAENAREARERNLSDNMKMTAGKYLREVSKAELELKKKALICREELTDRLFDKVAKKLADFRKTKDYPALLEKRLKQENPEGSAEITLAPEDMQFADRLKKAVKCDLSVTEDDTIKYGGFCLLRKDKGTVTDRTFDCVLSEQKNLFASRNILNGGGGEEQA